ncbi:MAG: Gx transporter family protein [Bacilli bacterium]|jgi:heptaprenyl diphosphate synthase|nr:Gx transporter family protein [Bacilli bacterium]
MINHFTSIKKLVFLALFLSIAIIVNIVENISFSVFIIPGIKLGLANIVTVFILYYFGYKEMFLINVLRVFLANLIIGTLFSTPFIIAMGSCLGSMILMYPIIKVNKFSIFGISMIQALLFNFFQIIIVCWLYQNYIFIYYFPYLMISGIITGYLVALCAKYVILILNKNYLKGEMG